MTVNRMRKSHQLSVVIILTLFLYFLLQVTYEVEGFIEKNNDLLYRDLSRAMYLCQHPLLKVIFPEGQCQGQRSKGHSEGQRSKGHSEGSFRDKGSPMRYSKD